MALGIGEIRGFPARKGASRTVNGVKQFDLYSSKSDSGRTYSFVGMIEGKDLIFQIQEMPKRTPVDTYVFNGAKSGLDLSQSDVDGIVDDYARLMKDSTLAEEGTPVDVKPSVVTTIREETVEGVTVTLQEVTNVPPSMNTFYEVKSSDTFVSNKIGTYNGQDLALAEESYDDIVNYLTNVKKATSNDYVYRDYEIRFFTNTDYSGDVQDGYVDILRPVGGVEKLYRDGDTVQYADQFGNRVFGTISLDEQNDLIILEEYIDAVLDERDDPEPTPDFVASGSLEIYSWGWYRDNSPDNPFSPFTKVEMVNCYTIPNTQGRILGIEDSDIPFVDSGAVHFRVKDGYAVKLRIMTQNKGYLGDNLTELPESEFTFDSALDALDSEVFGSNQDFDYEDTEQVDVIMTGNDYISIDIDGEVSGIANFRLTSGGVNMVKGAPNNIDDETFLQIIGIEKIVEGQKPTFEGGDVGQNGDSETETKMSWLPIVVAGVLIIGIMYLVFSNGGDE